MNEEKKPDDAVLTTSSSVVDGATDDKEDADGAEEAADPDPLVVLPELKAETQTSPRLKAASGAVGGCSWTLADDGTLTISGNGTLPNTGGIGNPPSQASMEANWPWYKDHRAEVKKVVVEEGVKAPKDMRGMFHGLENLETADLTGMDAANLEACHDMFSECKSLTEITFPSMFAPVQAWRMCKNCSSLTTINFGTADKPYNPTDIRYNRDNAFR